jgi:hypothetical protein
LTTEEKIKLLIAALSPSEKGYIRKFARAELSLAKAEQVDAVFDSMNRSGFQAEEWIYDLLMDALVEYNKNEFTEMRGILNQVDVLLVDKDLPDQAEKLILRGKKLAEKAKMTDMLMEISELETALLAIKPPGKELIRLMETTFEEIQELADEHDSEIFKKIKEVGK